MSPRELANALYGLALLLRFDGRAWEFFDKSPRGFWTSYTAALIVAPFHFGHLALVYSREPTAMGPIVFAIVQGLSYVLSWTLFPFAMIYAARFLGRTPLYFWHIVPYNWFQLPVGLALGVFSLAADFGLLPLDAYRFATLAAMVVMAIWSTFIAAVGLRITVGSALSLVVLDFTLAFTLAALVQRI
ncbi:MAG: hypothetical protein AB7E79_02420 [Rhodospirillaceae bacterium]